MRQPLTVIIPCKDEHRNIGACIESIHEMADEILVADSGSSDDTMKIAAAYSKVRIIQRDYRNSGDFKNWAIPQATHPWILLVDADERITPPLANEVVATLKSEPQCDGYWIMRANHYMGTRLHFGDARRDGVIRLFHRDRGRYEGPSDHGEVNIYSGRIGKLKNRMTHYTVWEYDQILDKYRRYTMLQARQWQEQGKDTSYFKLLVRPAFRFFREFILQGSILDGKAGLQTAWLAAFYSFSKQARLWSLTHGIDQDDIDTTVSIENIAPSMKADVPQPYRRAG